MKLRTKDPIWIKATDAIKMINPLWDEAKLIDFLYSSGLVPRKINLKSIVQYNDVVRRTSFVWWVDFPIYFLEVTDHVIERIKEILLTDAEAFYNDQYEYYKSIGQE